MKKTAYIIAMITASVLILTACGSKKTAEPETAAEEITAAETTAEVTQETAAETEAAEETEAEEAAVVAEETEAAEEETAEEVPAEEEPAVDEVFSNGLFSITIPAYFDGRYEVDYSADDNGIMVYDKAAKEAGCGGFAFGIAAFEDPADRAYLPGGTKVGELCAEDGTLYDIELMHPTDVQWDFNIGPDDYMELYEAGEDIARSMTGDAGSTFVYGAGTKGEDLYQEILAKHVDAISGEWDTAALAEEDMSPMYYTMALDGRGDVFDRIGYAYCDLNGDGVDELMIGEIADGDWKGIIYDLYAVINREPVHVLSATGKDRFFSGSGSTLCSEYSEGPYVRGLRVYTIDEGSGEISQIVDFKTDTYENEEQPWFVSYDPGNEDAWENVTEEDWNSYKANFTEYRRFDYEPLSGVRDAAEEFAAYDVYRDLLRSAGYGEESTCVITQKYPCADAVGSAIAYAYLLNEIGVDAEAAIGGALQEEVAYALDVFGVTIPVFAETAGEGQYVLIDHSSYADAVDGMDGARILGLVDRHGIGDVVSSGPVNIRVAPVGATSTLVYKAYEECGIKIPRNMARVLLMGIVSETGNLTKYYTALDKQAYKELKAIARIKDFDGFCELMAAVGEPGEEILAEEEAEETEETLDAEPGEEIASDETEAEEALTDEAGDTEEAVVEEEEEAEAEAQDEAAPEDASEEEISEDEEEALTEEDAEITEPADADTGEEIAEEEVSEDKEAPAADEDAAAEEEEAPEDEKDAAKTGSGASKSKSAKVHSKADVSSVENLPGIT